MRSAETLQAADGFRLAADLHLPEGPPRAAALLAPAMGVQRRFYAPFCEFLALGGVATLVVDYRGIGDSRPASAATRLRDWGELDLAAALEHLRGRFAGVPLRFIGHSVGGQLLGLLQAPPIDRALFVAAQSGYWRHWGGLRALGIAALWYAAVPALITATGRLPMRAFRQGEDVPAGVGREWARWGRHPEYIGSYARGRGTAFESWAGSIQAHAISDDGYAPEPAVRALVAAYARASVEVRVHDPRSLGVRRIGHFGCFSPRFEAGLWGPWREFLLAPAASARPSAEHP